MSLFLSGLPGPLFILVRVLPSLSTYVPYVMLLNVPSFSMWYLGSVISFSSFYVELDPELIPVRD